MQLWCSLVLVLIHCLVAVHSDLCLFEPVLTSESVGVSVAVTDVKSTLECWNSFPLSEEVKDGTIAVVRQVLDLYSFTDIYRDSGAPWFKKVLAEEELDRISEASYESEWAFHRDILALYNQFGDAHLTYALPSAYSQFTFIRPFEFSMRATGPNGGLFVSRQVLFRNIPISYFLRLVGAPVTDVRQYVGREVVAINDKPIIQYLRDIVSESGIYLDEGARLNNALRSGLFTAWSTDASFMPPSSDTEIYTFADGSSVELPVFVIVNTFQEFNSETFRSLQQRREASSSARKATKTPARAQIQDPFHNENRWIFFHETPMRRINKHEKFEYKSIPVKELYTKAKLKARALRQLDDRTDSEDIKLKGESEEGMFTWWVYDKPGDTPAHIWRLSGFSSNGPQLQTFPFQSFVYSWMSEMDKALLHARDHNITNLLLDLSGNGGGLISLAFRTAYLLAKELNSLERISGRYDFRRTALGDRFYLENDYLKNSSNFYADVRTAQPIPLVFEDWYFNGPEFKRGGVESNYTNQYYSADVFWFAISYDEQRNVVPIARVHFFDKILFLTDGTCGSACSQFSSVLNFYNIGEYVSYGGFYNEKLDTSAFAGGSVLEWPDLVATRPDLLSNFPTSANTRVNLEEMYVASSSIPRQLDFIPARFHLKRWPQRGQYQPNKARTILHPLYRKVLALFNNVTEIGPLGEYEFPPLESPQSNATKREIEKPSNNGSSRSSRNSNGSRARVTGSVSGANVVQVAWVVTLFFLVLWL